MVTGRRIEAGHRRPRRDLERRPPPPAHRPGRGRRVGRVRLHRRRRRRPLRGLLREQDEVLAVGPLVAAGHRRADDHRGQPGAGPGLQARPRGRHPRASASCTSPSPTSSVTRRASWVRPTSAPCAAPTAGSGASSTCCARDPRYAGHTTVILTADHGGRGESHYDATSIHDYRVPFVVWGTGVDPGTDLYDLNPDYADPGRDRTSYDGVQPIRNGRSPTWPSTSSGCRPSPTASTTSLRTSTSARLTSHARSAAHRSPGNGHGLNRQPREPLGLLHHHRRRTARPGAADVSATEPVPGLVVDHHVPVVAQRRPARRSTRVRRASTAPG